jgi:glycine oxidase
VALHDVIIAGAGIIGVSLALELRDGGARVLVLDEHDPGQGASSAAAGMLAATDPETPVALRELATESARLFPEFVERVEADSGISADFRRHGTLVLGQGPFPENHRPLSPSELAEFEPDLDPGPQHVFLVAENAVDPALLMQAALRAAEANAIEIRPGTKVLGMQVAAGAVEVRTARGTLSCLQGVNCCGAWSDAPVRPRKGQMLYLRPERAGILEHVLRSPEVYLVPRSSGKILVGATVEDVGFNTDVDPAVIERLHSSAAKYVPQLACAPAIESWAGLRPGTPDDLPIMGETQNKGIFVATGHFRNGILLAPATARVMARLMGGEAPGMDLTAFSPQRFATAKVQTS